MNNSKNEKIIVHLVPSAHWDREWYLPFSRYQVRLVRLMDKVISLLESGKYPSYTLDGQTAMIEDYLEVKPQKRAVLKKLISEGKLVVGPWYTVPDTFIPCGESLWKNLELGKQAKTEFGGKGEVAYTPDSFGLNSQTAQLFRIFGYPYAMYTRGARLQNEADSGVKNDVTLYSPDGSKVLAQYDKYSLGNGLVVPNIWRNFARLKVEKQDALRCANWVLEYQSKKTAAKNRLWICGIDHLEPREDLGDVAALLNKEIDGVTFQISSMDAFFKALEQENLAENAAYGEQRGIYKKHFELGNTLSSRMDIKLLNRETENLLFGYAEGLDIQPHVQPVFDRLDRDSVLDNAYKHLIRSHAHDSICTCGVDEMCSDEKNRLRWAKEAAEEVLKDDLQTIGSSLKNNGFNGEILVYNPLPYPRSTVAEGKLSIPYAVDGNCICDENGTPIPDSYAEVLFRKRIDIETSKYVRFSEIEQDQTRIHRMPGCQDQDMQTGIYYRFYAENIPPLGFRRYTLGKSDVVATEIVGKDKTIENERLSLEIEKDGSVSVYEKKNGYILRNTCIPVCDADDGDTYTYANVDGTASNFPESVTVGAAVKNALAEEIESEYRLRIPRSEKTVCVRMTYRLEKGADCVRVCAKVQNSGERFRLRVLVRTENACDFVASDTAFDFVERPIYQKSELTPLNIMTMPCRNAVYIPSKQYALGVYSASFHEYEAWKDGTDCVTAFTLLRSVSQVYNTALPTKDESVLGAGARWLSEDAKMHGEYEFYFALAFLSKNENETTILQRASEYQFPLYVCGITPYGEQDSEKYGGLRLEGAVWSAFERKDGCVVARYYNPRKESVSVKITYKGKTLTKKLAPKKIGETDMREFL